MTSKIHHDVDLFHRRVAKRRDDEAATDRECIEARKGWFTVNAASFSFPSLKAIPIRRLSGLLNRMRKRMKFPIRRVATANSSWRPLAYHLTVVEAVIQEMGAGRDPWQSNLRQGET